MYMLCQEYERISSTTEHYIHLAGVGGLFAAVWLGEAI